MSIPVFCLPVRNSANILSTRSRKNKSSIEKLIRSCDRQVRSKSFNLLRRYFLQGAFQIFRCVIWTSSTRRRTTLRKARFLQTSSSLETSTKWLPTAYGKLEWKIIKGWVGSCQLWFDLHLAFSGLIWVTVPKDNLIKLLQVVHQFNIKADSWEQTT